MATVLVPSPPLTAERFERVFRFCPVIFLVSSAPPADLPAASAAAGWSVSPAGKRRRAVHDAVRCPPVACSRKYIDIQPQSEAILKPRRRVDR
jgi:hypothetical protein